MRRAVILIYGDETLSYDFGGRGFPEGWDPLGADAPPCGRCGFQHQLWLTRHLHELHRVACSAGDAQLVHTRLHDASRPFWEPLASRFLPVSDLPVGALTPSVGVVRPFTERSAFVVRELLENPNYQSLRTRVALEHEILPLHGSV